MSELMDYEAIREADFILIDSDIYDKFIPIDWEDIEEWRKNNVGK